MAVIINELEVVAEQPKPVGAVPPLPRRAPAAALNPLDLADVLERQIRYRNRLDAD